MASPATLPISNPESESKPAIAIPAFRVLISRLNADIRHGLSEYRPWLELIDRSSLSRPDSLSEAASRMRRNSSYFRVNYASVLALSLALALLTDPFSLFVVLLSLLVGCLFLYSVHPSDTPLVIAERAFSKMEALGVLLLCILVVVFLTTVGSLLIYASLIGLALVCAHGAAFTVPKDFFLDHQEPPAHSALLSELDPV